MKILLFLNKDLEANLAYHILKPVLQQHTIKIYYSVGVGNPKKKPNELVQLEYFEKTFIYTKLKDYLEKKQLQSAFDFFDETFQTVPLLECSNVNSPKFIEEVRAFEPDLFISIRFGKIFKDEIIRIPKKGILNLHSAILPDFRGILGTLHTLKAARKEVGCTLHYISDSGIDTGEIIDIARLAVRPDKSLFWHVVQLYPLGCAMIKKQLQVLMQQEKTILQKQNLQEGNYFSVPQTSDFEQMTALGFKTISKTDYLETLQQWISEELHLDLLADENIS